MQRVTTVRLELTGNVSPLIRAIDEQTDLALGPSSPGRPKTRYQHVPVRMPSPTTMELEWAVAPSVATLLALLNDHGIVTGTTKRTLDYAHLDALTREEQEKCLLDLVESGNMIAAVRAARRLYGYDLMQAKEFVNGLRGPRDRTGSAGN
jgi:hypothetical protein